MAEKDPTQLIELKIGNESTYIEILPNETIKEFSTRIEEKLGVKMDIGDVDQDTDVLSYFTLTNQEKDPLESETVVEEGLFCCVPGCSSNTVDNPDSAIFKLPSQRKRCWEWLAAINRNDLQKSPLKFLSSRLGVCRDHFSDDQFTKDKSNLKSSALPSLPTVKKEEIQGTEWYDSLEPAETEDNSHPGAMCRLCANILKSEPIFIFDKKYDGKTCAEIINGCLPIEITQTDALPKQICQPCFERVKLQNSFAEACAEAEKKLISITNRFQLSDKLGVRNKTSFCCPLCCLGGMSHTKDFVDVPRTDGSQILEAVDEGLYSDDGESDNNESETSTEVSPTKSVYLSEDQNFAYECEICEESFNGASECLEHCLGHCSHEYFPCMPCGLVFTSQDSLESHFSQHKIKLSNARRSPWKTVLLCLTCGYQTTTRKNFILHKCSNPILEQTNFEVAKDLSCSTCNRVFLSSSRAAKHRAGHEGTECDKYFCELCKVDLITENMMIYHASVVHEGIEHRCTDCGLRFVSNHHLDRHKRVHAKTLPAETQCQYKCQICLRKFVSLTAINKHLATHEEGDQIRECPKCPQKFQHRSHLQHHLETSHDQLGRMPSLIQYQCNICWERITSSSEVLVHRTTHWKSHDPLLPHVCEYCGEAHPSPNALARHRRYLHPDEHPYICAICETATRTLYEARVHRKTHTGYAAAAQQKPQVKIYKCEQCPSLFTDKDSYVTHRKKHKNAKWHPCDQCNKAFPERHRLMIHQRQHTGEKPYSCGTCGKRFAQTSAMYTHALKHTGETPHACDLCNRKFRIKSDRDSHRRTHTGEKPYKCPFCFKTFRTGQVYYQHRMIHTGERRFRCDVCGQAFKRSHTLAVHKRIHTGEKPNICDVCGKGFRQRTDMRKHRMHVHGVSG